MIVTLTVNPAIDLSTSVEEVVPIHKLRCAEIRRDPGGGGINVARVARRLGADVVAIYPMGGIIGRLLHQLVEAEGLASVAVPVGEETREDFTVLDRRARSEFRFVLPGPHLTEPEWLSCLDALDDLATSRRGARYLAASGSLPPGVPPDFYARTVKRVQVGGVRVALDTSGDPLEAALAEGVYLVKPNLRELSELLGETLGDDHSQLAACRKLIARGGAEIVALSLGAEGAMLVTGDHAWRAKPPPVEPASTVGAGDSFLAGILASLDRDRPIEEAFRCGVAAGTAALLSPGTGLCHAADVTRLMTQVTVNPID